MIPRALRLNGQMLAAVPVTSSIIADLGTSVVAGSHWYFSLDQVTPADFGYLAGVQGSSVLLQALHPANQRWTMPLSVHLRILVVPVASPSDTLPGVTAGLTMLPTTPGPVIPGLPVTTMYLAPILPHHLTGIPGLLMPGGDGPGDIQVFPTKLLLDAMILTSGIYDTPKFYTIFYT